MTLITLGSERVKSIQEKFQKHDAELLALLECSLRFPIS